MTVDRTLPRDRASCPGFQTTLDEVTLVVSGLSLLVAETPSPHSWSAMS
jgi:hypothetical protein